MPLRRDRCRSGSCRIRAISPATHGLTRSGGFGAGCASTFAGVPAARHQPEDVMQSGSSEAVAVIGDPLVDAIEQRS
jgi:hypothetical protein